MPIKILLMFMERGMNNFSFKTFLLARILMKLAVVVYKVLLKLFILINLCEESHLPQYGNDDLSIKVLVLVKAS